MVRIAKAKKAGLVRLAGRFLRDENGSTAIEYGLIAAILVVALISSLVTLKQSLMDGFYTPVASSLNTTPEG